MIRIDEAQLTAFGKFRNKRIRFSEGLQVFCGANEAGKSTLQMFFRVMLYGVPAQRKGTVLLKDRDRMIPWGEKYAQGVLRLTVDGRQIEIHRRFGSTAAGDRTEVLDRLTGEAIAEFSGEQPGEKLLGIPVEVFEKTFWIRQNAVFPVGTDEEISRRLMNLKETGEEDVSAENTITALEQERKALRAKDKRETAGVLDRLYQEREAKVQERFMLLSEMGQRRSAQKRRDQAAESLKQAEAAVGKLHELEKKQKQLQSIEARRAKWLEVKRLQGLAAQAKNCEACTQFGGLQEETVQKAEILKRKLETLDQTVQIGYDNRTLEDTMGKLLQKKQRGALCFGVGAGLLLLALVLGVLRIPYWLGVLLAGSGAGLGLMAAGVVLWKNAAGTLAELKTEKEGADARCAQEKAEMQSLQQELSKILGAYSCQSTEELRQGMERCRKAELEAESYQNACLRLLEGEDSKSLEAEMADLQELTAEERGLLKRDIPEEIRRNQKIQMDALSEMKELEGKLSYVYHGSRNPADVQAELDQLDARILEGETKLKAVNLAAQVFRRVHETRKSDFTPEVNAKIRSFLDILLAGKYRDIRVSDSYRMRVDTEDAHAVAAEYFSRGTYEQIYFALRLALGSLMGDGSEPLFLDDLLTSFDDLRTKNAIELLKLLGEHRQILLFTCHGRVKEIGAEVSVRVNDLEEEIEDVC